MNVRVPWLLELRGLTVAYDQKVVLNNLNLQLRAGESIAVVGPSGSGKTTLLRTLLGLLPDNSQIGYEVAQFDGSTWPTSEMAWHTLRGRAIVYVPQDAHASLSVVKTIVEQCRDVAKAIQLPWSEAQERIQRLLQQLDLPSEVLQQRPNELSGGMAQRVVMLLALLPKPKLIVADEPTANLDVVRQQQMVVLLRQIQAQSGAALVFVTHQLELAAQLSHTIYEMKKGQLQKIALQKDTIHTKPEYIKKIHATEKCSKDAALERPLVKVEDIKVAYEGGDPVLHNVSLTLKAGEWIALMGLSGAGKSTFFNTLLGWQQVQHGRITYDGIPLHDFTMRELGRIVQPILQNSRSSFNPRQTIGWSIGEALNGETKFTRNKKTVDLGDKQSVSVKNNDALMPRHTVSAKVSSLLAQVQLPAEYAKRYPHELSGGECQRAALARALSSEPQLLLCDEITSALDPVVRLEIIQALWRIRQQRELAGIVITHDLPVATTLCDYIYVLEEGTIVEKVTPSDLLAKPHSKTAKRLVQAYENWQAI